MFRKDYLLRLIQMLIDAILQIKNSIAQQEFDVAKKQITDAYALLGNDRSFFIGVSLDELLSFLKTKEGDYMKRLQMLFDIMYYDMKVEEKNDVRKEVIEKCMEVGSYCEQNSTEYSFDFNNKLLEVKNELENLSQL